MHEHNLIRPCHLLDDQSITSTCIATDRDIAEFSADISSNGEVEYQDHETAYMILSQSGTRNPLYVSIY